MGGLLRVCFTLLVAAFATIAVGGGEASHPLSPFMGGVPVPTNLSAPPSRIESSTS